MYDDDFAFVWFLFFIPVFLICFVIIPLTASEDGPSRFERDCDKQHGIFHSVAGKETCTIDGITTRR